MHTVTYSCKILLIKHFNKLICIHISLNLSCEHAREPHAKIANALRGQAARRPAQAAGRRALRQAAGVSLLRRYIRECVQPEDAVRGVEPRPKR